MKLVQKSRCAVAVAKMKAWSNPNERSQGRAFIHPFGRVCKILWSDSVPRYKTTPRRRFCAPSNDLDSRFRDALDFLMPSSPCPPQYLLVGDPVPFPSPFRSARSKMTKAVALGTVSAARHLDSFQQQSLFSADRTNTLSCWLCLLIDNRVCTKHPLANPSDLVV
jgi:hypothetical protein